MRFVFHFAQKIDVPSLLNIPCRNTINFSDMTHSFFLSLPFLFVALTLPAQKIPVELSKRAEKPAAFDLPDRNTAVFLFHHVKKGRLILQAREVNPAFSILRKVNAPEMPGKYSSFSFVCGAVRDSILHAYFVADDTDVWLAQLRLSDFSLQFQKSVSFREKEQYLGGFAQQGKYSLLTRIVESRTKGLLFLYENPGMPGAKTHTVPLGGTIRLTATKYQPFWPDATVELSPEIAAGVDKVTFDTGYVWFSSGLKIKNTAVETPTIELSTLSLQDFTLKTEQIQFDQATTRPTEKAKAAHALLDRKLFTVFCHSEQMVIQVQDVMTRRVLWQEELAATDDTMTVFNSPVILPGRGALGIKREYHTGEKFIPRFLKFNPFLQVRRDSSGYILSMGGFLLVEGGGGGPVFMPGSPGISTPFGSVSGTPGRWTSGGWGGSHERSANFYIALDVSPPATPGDASGPAFSPSDILYDNTFFGEISTRFNAISDVADGVFYLFGQHYFGHYVRENDTYRLVRLHLGAQKKS
ncbi:MAG: hypothetical protein IPM81_06590 [Saprospirales bacterium]|nr:hypothetical protein [Saprospirales bacterium]